MLQWVSELVMPLPPPRPVPVVPLPPPAAVAPTGSVDEASAAAPAAPPPPDPLLEAVSEVMVHVAEGRLEMAALSLRYADDALGAADPKSPDEEAAVAALRESLSVSRVRLEEAVRRQLAEGGGAGESARCCKLLCMLGKEEEAFGVLKSSVAATFEAAAEAVRRQLQGGQDRGQFYVESASRVFSCLMDLVADHQGLLIQQFGVARFFEVVSLLQQACDSLFSVLFERFLERRVRPTVQRVASARPAAGSKGGGGDEADEGVAGLGQLLDEMTKLSLRCEIFGHFVDQVNREALAYARQIGQDTAALQRHHDAIAAALAHSLVRRGNMESMSNYVVLEMQFLQASLRRTRREPFCLREAYEQAVVGGKNSREEEKKRLAELESRAEECGFVDPDAYFFVLDRSCQRALSGRNAAIACSILSASGSQVELDLFDWLAEAWEGPASRSTALFCMLLDRVLVCSTLCGQIQSRLQAVAARYFAESASAQEKVRSCLETLGAASGRRLLEAAQAKSARHIAVVVPPSELGELVARMERLSWDDSNCAASVEPLAKEACEAVHRMGAVYRDAAASEAVQQLVCGQLAKWIAQRMEALIGGKRFSQSGAVGLESFVQMAAVALGPLCGAAELRSSFDRLRHMCTVLAVDVPSDVSDLWPSLPLAIEEVRAVAARRCDFSAKDIATLRFGKK